MTPQVGLLICPQFCWILHSPTVDLTEEEGRCAEAGIMSPHETTAAAFIFLGIELEDMQ